MNNNQYYDSLNIQCFCETLTNTFISLKDIILLKTTLLAVSPKLHHLKYLRA